MPRSKGFTRSQNIVTNLGRRPFNWFVVDKIRNDVWLEEGTPTYTYKDRPWATGFRTEIQAVTFALRNDPETKEIESPTGFVFSYEDGEWIKVFT